MMKNIEGALAFARAYLKNKNIDNPTLDAEVLLANCLGMTRVGLYTNWGRELSSREAELFYGLVKGRGSGEPVAYLVGYKEFMGLEFLVNQEVLIPRPETELLVEKALGILRDNKVPGRLFSGELGGKPSPLVVDVGTGSGAIAVSIAKYNTDARILALDKSGEALKVARINAQRHNVGDRLVFFCGNLLEPLNNVTGEFQQTESPCDLIVANLPYIPTGEIPTLSRELGFEPTMALDGGKDGLILYRPLIEQAYEILRPGGHLLAEIGSEQAARVLAIIAEQGAEKWFAHILTDLAGRDRLLCAQKTYNLEGEYYFPL